MRAHRKRRSFQLPLPTDNGETSCSHDAENEAVGQPDMEDVDMEEGEEAEEAEEAEEVEEAEEMAEEEEEVEAADKEAGANDMAIINTLLFVSSSPSPLYHSPFSSVTVTERPSVRKLTNKLRLFTNGLSSP
ncbi:hypothetical protein EMPS_03886 [Entomortierella parvispora]|uniref:Uncharacterized protein n=1 Tax=Entomortierella parvispora TaxID=205924 RepID=A0A9P3H7L9_9FUNG|nr:hypothetical protein EMPS_03886 [Entomortierella parvispora]